MRPVLDRVGWRVRQVEASELASLATCIYVFFLLLSAARAPPPPAHATPLLPRQMRPGTRLWGASRPPRRPPARVPANRPARPTRQVVERAWVRVAREAVGAEGQVVAQQWLVHTTAPGVRTEDRHRLDVVIYKATPNGSALCCDATLVSPLTSTIIHLHARGNHSHARPTSTALRPAERRKAATYPELRRQGPQKLLVLGNEVGGQHHTVAEMLVASARRMTRTSNNRVRSVVKSNEQTYRTYGGMKLPAMWPVIRAGVFRLLGGSLSPAWAGFPAFGS